MKVLEYVEVPVPMVRFVGVELIPTVRSADCPSRNARHAINAVSNAQTTHFPLKKEFAFLNFRLEILNVFWECILYKFTNEFF